MWLVAAIVSLAALVCLTTTNAGVPYMGRWYSLPATPAAPARGGQGLHGLVSKAGPVDLKRFYSKLGVESCYDERRRWTAAAAARRNLTQSELEDLRRTPCVTCQVFVVSRGCRAALGLSANKPALTGPNCWHVAGPPALRRLSTDCAHPVPVAESYVQVTLFEDAQNWLHHPLERPLWLVHSE